MQRAPPGEYLKSDGGVRFAVRDLPSGGQQFIFHGRPQTLRWVAQDRFEIDWPEWGRSDFTLRGDGVLVERGEHEFRRVPDLRVAPGQYVKSDGGVGFAVRDRPEGGQEFVYKGHPQPIILQPGGTFEIEWPEWGRADFSLRGDGVLLERGSHEFRRLSDGPCACTELTVEQLHAFRDIGALVLHGAVPPEAVRRALLCGAVRDTVGAAAAAAASLDGEGGGQKKHWHTANTEDPAVLALAGYAWHAVRAVLGQDAPLPTTAQIAVQCPGGSPLPPGTVGDDPHIDGMHAPGNGVPEGELRNFTMLLGIALTDVSSFNMGNLGYIPGSHKAIARAAARLGAEQTVAALSVTASENVQIALARVVDVHSLSPPSAVCCRPGGAYITHYQTVHFVQPNALGVAPRVAIYFRITAPGRPGNPRCRPECLVGDNIFMEMQGLPR